jgi:outer membrane protein TolC
MKRRIMRQCLCWICANGLAWAQQIAIAPIQPAAPAIVRPYLAPEFPPVRLANSPRLRELVRAGTIYLTVQDAIALALENNIDIAVARYNPLIAAWNVTRAEAGGALPGVPSNASQAGAVAVGQGVTGSQAAAGIRILGTGSNRAQTTNVTIQQIGPITQNLDPIVQEASTFSHTSTPQPNAIQSAVQALISDTRAYNATFQQGTLTGGTVSLTYTDNYLNENSPTDVLNPSSAASLAIAAQHNLLQGFGVAVNSRFITVAKMNAGISDVAFKNQVVTIVSQVLNSYYNLAAAYEDVKAKTAAADTARAFFANIQEEVRIGSLAPTETINAENQVLTSTRALVDSQAVLDQQEVQLKNLLSRTGTADPVLRDARIVPTDRIEIPADDNLPPMIEMVKEALANRPDLAVERENEQTAEISNLGTKNGILPTLGIFAAESQAGLAGTPRTVVFQGFTETADPYFVGGLGTALDQVFRRNFPTERIGAFYFASLRNRQAQADYAIDQLQFRQTQLTTRKNANQVQVDILNNAIALQQARARYDAAVHNRDLQQQLLTAEQKRFRLGASIPYNVIQQQRDLIASQSAEVAALAAYGAARIALDRTRGVLLTAYHVSLAAPAAGH